MSILRRKVCGSETDLFYKKLVSFISTFKDEVWVGGIGSYEIIVWYFIVLRTLI